MADASDNDLCGSEREVIRRAKQMTATAVQGRVPDPRKWTIHRNRRGWPRWYQRWLEAWWIIIGKWSLHRAWQDGKDHGSMMEYQRTVVNGGR